MRKRTHSLVLPAPAFGGTLPRFEQPKVPGSVVLHPSAFEVGSRLHIGCGPKRIPGWINADAVPGVGDLVVDLSHDALPPDTFTCIYGSHVLEHCYAEETPAILSKLYRSLSSGGTLRLSVPDIRLIVKNCIDGHAYGDDHSALSVLFGGTFSRATTEPDRHKQIFWHERLGTLLYTAGFSNVREWQYGQYDEIDALADYATWPRDGSGRSLISLNLEGTKL